MRSAWLAAHENAARIAESKWYSEVGLGTVECFLEARKGIGMRKPSYRKKGHKHKPEKGRGSYRRKDKTEGSSDKPVDTLSGKVEDSL